MRSSAAILASISTLVAVLTLAPAAHAAPTPQDNARERLDVYVGEVSADQLTKIVALGVDRDELDVSGPAHGRGGKATMRVETIISGRQAGELRDEGVELAPKEIRGATAAERATAQATGGLSVFKRYGGPGGIREELERVAADNPRIAKLVSFGTSVDGQDIVALKVSRNARTTRDGSRPSVLYLGAQHAREWITPEMVRRLMHHVVDGYDRDSMIRRLVDTTELWFAPVANPDGYDWTFEPGQRLWRKNLRDNNGDGQIAAGDGVDLNRNFPTRWGYDNEGSSPDPAGETYRGPSPASEPETRALDALARRVRFTFFVDYHSAAELLLYGTGWQVSTPTPDDVIYEALAGDDAHPAIPGYDPDVSAELYTTNGDTNTHLSERYGTLSFTPEMSTCETASDSDPADRWAAAACGSSFEFPDDEALVQAEFEKNLPFALSLARSAPHPDEPTSVVGRTAEDFRVDSFDVSYGDPQPVAVVARRALRGVQLNYRIGGGRTRTARVTEWAGGERYGNESDNYYAELRGTVRGARPGDTVEVWFTGVEPGGGRVASRRFAYRLARDTGARVLVLANEDYKGVNPTYPAGTSAPKYAAQYVADLRAAGYDADVWDVDAQGVPHDLGVLGHYDAVVWYLGDNRLTQDPQDELITTPLGELPDLAVAERQQYLTMAVRDYLNEGGKLVHAGETAQYQGLEGLGDAVGGLFYGLNGDPAAECVVRSMPGFFGDCLVLADDFRQYYLGAFTRRSLRDPKRVVGIGEPIAGYEGDLGGPVVAADNPLDEAGVFRPTSEVLPAAQFPQFASRAAAQYPLERGSPFAPVEGERYAAALHADASYMRLSKTVDLTSASSAQLQFQLSLSSEPGYDHLIVEARTAGQEDWTTLPELNGATTTAAPAECADPGPLLAMHPFLRHYLGGADCTAPGTSGTWNAFTGSTNGWKQVAFDLSGLRGRQVELSIAYVSDPASGGVGAFVDDTRVAVDGSTSADGFEGATSTWTPGGPPAASPPLEHGWQIGARLVNDYAGTSTRDTLLLGFGVEQLATEAQRRTLLAQALGGLIGRRTR
jgi:hypothetical protein